MQKMIIFAAAMLAISVSFAQDAQTQQEQDRAKKMMFEAQANLQEKLATITIDNGARNFVFVGGELLNRNPVKGKPYSADAVTETTQTLADGNHIVNRSSSSIYRDSEGRERREESIGRLGAWNAQGEPAKAVFVSDPVAKMSFTLHPNDHTAEKRSAEAMPINFKTVTTNGGGRSGPAVQTTTVLTGGEPGPVAVGFARRGIAESASSSKVEQLGNQTFEGVVAQGTRTTAVIPAGEIGNERDISIVSERWFSSELGVVVMSKQSDPRMGETVYRLTNINRNEPAHSMFEIPADYTVSDSAAMKLREDKLDKVRKEEQ
jgi:hypothetical protein